MNVKLGKGFMRFFASIGRQTGLALLRWMLVCAMLAVVSTQSHHAFASEIKSLLALPFIPKKLNESRIIDYLLIMFDDKEKTFYNDILRLYIPS